jgi:hypothetical protein
VSHPRRATCIELEPEDGLWPETGVNVQVMQPGQPNCRYHSEPEQEDLLVSYGECIVILDGEERARRRTRTGARSRGAPSPIRGRWTAQPDCGGAPPKPISLPSGSR